MRSPSSPTIAPERNALRGLLDAPAREGPRGFTGLSGAEPDLNVVIRHDDAVREYAYDRRATVGRLDTLLDEATRRGWVVVSMKRDWRVLFPPARR
jgi:hypothetical protein